MSRPGTGDRAPGKGHQSSGTHPSDRALNPGSSEPGTRSPEPVSIVGVRFLNARPLLAGLEAGIPAAFPYRFEAAEPATCADRLAGGAADVGLVPVAALPAAPGLRALPALGVAARHEVRSVLLVSRVPLERVCTLAAHTASRTSIALARLLLAERWGATPRVVPARPPLDAMLADADAAVIIGDPALAAHGRTGLAEVDLAGAWVEWSGLPFVFAVWGIGPVRRAGVESLLERSLEYAEERWVDLVPAWARAHGLGHDETREYLGRTLTFRLGERERAGAEEFLRRAAGAGLLPACGEVWDAR